MLDAEAGLHAEGGTLLDGEGLLVERLEGTGLGQVDDDVGSALNLEAQGEQDDFAVIVGVGDALAAAETKRLFPLAERLIVLVCGGVCVSEMWRCKVGMNSEDLFWGVRRPGPSYTWRDRMWCVAVCIFYCNLPSFWYSSMVFFSPTLKPSVCSGTRSSWTAASLDMMANGPEVLYVVR